MVSGSFLEFWYSKENLARVVRKADNAIHWINHTYHIYPLVLSGSPVFEQLGPGKQHKVFEII